MLPDKLNKILNPNQPIHKRTETDIPSDKKSVSRGQSQGLLSTQMKSSGLHNPKLISSHQGSIDRILFAFPDYAVKNKNLVKAYKSLIKELRVGTKFIVLHHESVENIIQSWFEEFSHPTNNVLFAPVPNYVNFTDWAEDAYVALQDTADNKYYLIEPWAFPRSGDSLLAEIVQDNSNIIAGQAPLIFQGGNCLIGEDFWLLGKDYFADSVELTQGNRPPVTIPQGTTPEKFVRQLFKDYTDDSRELIVIGTNKVIPLKDLYGTEEGGKYYIDLAKDGVGTFQPIFHIDMFITLLGFNDDEEFEVLLGSPEMADKILGTNSPYSLQDVYDKIEVQLTDAGMKVIRNPLVHRPSFGNTRTIAQWRELASQPGNEALLDTIGELIAAGATDTSPATVRTWHHITWNNCLVENSDTLGKHVYLPTFGYGENRDLKTIDLKMKKIWEDLGFTVHLLGDFNEFARRQGVVHCITKYLERGA